MYNVLSILKYTLFGICGYFVKTFTANIVVCRKFSRQEGAVCNIGSYRVVRVSFSSFIDLEVFTSRNLWAFLKTFTA